MGGWLPTEEERRDDYNVVFKDDGAWKTVAVYFLVMFVLIGVIVVAGMVAR